MAVVGALVGIAAAAILVTLVVGLVTGRIDWRADGCCSADPARDLRMRDAVREAPATPPGGPVDD